MSFQTPITIAKALYRIQDHEYVLPAIQREFVWSTDQICRLFDSLVQGYPIGSFLFWSVAAQHNRDYVFYDFIRDFHQFKAPHCPRLDLLDAKPVTAILDGQQRLTALNIGLRGSHAEKLPRKRWNNLDAYPKKELYLNLLSLARENDLGMEFDFRFLTERQAASAKSSNEHWFPVKYVLDLQAGPGIFKYIQEFELGQHERAYYILDRLHEVVHREPSINYFEEEDQDLDKVLNIFIRVNSGGTVLSYSDLLLSIATAEWRDLDAREVIHDLVDDLNNTGQGFAFSKDLVLKAGLILTDINDIRFKVTNFTSENMSKLESQWEAVSTALRLAAELIANFGLSERTLRADSVLIPVAYYLAQRELGESYLSSPKFDDDRRSLRFWVIRSLVKAGIWGSGLDTLLSALRASIRGGANTGFPSDSIENAMARLGKSLRFDDDEIGDLVETPYGNRNVFPILSLIYPGMSVRGEFHVDHIFPRSRFGKKQLQSAGVPEEQIEEFRQKMDGLPNLQLLEGPINVQKLDKLPNNWAVEHYPDEDARGMYLAAHDMHDLPNEITEFLTFYETRRERIDTRLRELLGVGVSQPK